MKFLSSEKLSEHKYKTPEGYLVCVDAILARTGKQTYRKNEVFTDSDDDSEIEVDRTPEEVFNPKTLASFENKPITVEHPDENVTVENHNSLSVGFVRDVHKGVVNGQDVMLGTLVITDGQTIEEIENGEHTDLSCGYDCDIVDEANPQQRNIRGNHVALCQQGRAGIARIVDSYDSSNPRVIEFKGNKHLVEKLRDIAKNYRKKELREILCEETDFNPKMSDKEIEEAARELGIILKDSIKDVEPHKNESKDDFISRFMSETKEEYPDEKQRLAVAYSYWNKKDTKDENYKIGQKFISPNDYIFEIIKFDKNNFGTPSVFMKTYDKQGNAGQYTYIITESMFKEDLQKGRLKLMKDSLHPSDYQLIDDVIEDLHIKTISNALRELNEQFTGFVGSNVTEIIDYLKKKGFKDSKINDAYVNGENENPMDWSYRGMSYDKNNKVVYIRYHEKTKRWGFSYSKWGTPKKENRYSTQSELNNHLADSIKDLYSLNELRNMRVDTYHNTDIYKVDGMYCTNPNTSKERFLTIEQVKKYIDKRLFDSTLSNTQEQELRRYAQRFNYDMDEVYDGLNSRIKREHMSVAEAIENLKEAMTTKKSLYDSTKKYQIREVDSNNIERITLIKAESLNDAINKYKRR